MKYTFWRGDEVWETDVPMANISDIQRDLEARGWHRVWDVPRFHMYLSYVEALQESTDMADEDDRQRAVQRREAQKDLAQALREDG